MSKNIKRLTSMLLILSIIIVGVYIPVAAVPSGPEAPSPTNQIVSHGDPRYYDVKGDEVTTSPQLGTNSVVSVYKAITPTANENEFDMTLTVKTTVDVREMPQSADAAVVLVLDISGSMGGGGDDPTDYMPSLRSSATNFVNSFASESGDAARYVALVTFSGDAEIVYSWTDIKVEANKTALLNHIKGLQAVGATFVQGGLQLARNLMRTDALPKGKDGKAIENRSVILFSDGETNRYTYSTTVTDYTTGTTVLSTGGPGNVFDAESRVAAETMATAVKTGTSFGGFPKHTAYLYTIAFGSSAPTAWMRDNIATNSTYAYSAANAQELNNVFAAIVKRIESWAEAWIVTDPMGANIDFLTTLAPNDVADGLYGYQYNIFSWDIKKALPNSFINDIYTYNYTYRIRLDTTRSTYSPGVTYPTNGETQLTYVILEEGIIVSDILIATFAVPSVKGFPGGSLTFSKVGDNSIPLPGCTFTLTNQGKTGHYLAAQSGNGTAAVTFTNIPSGYTYTLSESDMPPAYKGLFIKSNETFTVQINYGVTNVSNSSGDPVDINNFKFNNPVAGRTLTGFVWPMVVDDLDLGDDFIKQHDIVVELRPTFLTPASSELSTKAVLKNDDGLGEFTIEDVPPGDYVLYIKRPGYLARAMPVTVNASSPAVIELSPPFGSVDNGVFNLWGGDCNDDLMIESKDTMMILELMAEGVDVFDPRYNAACDFNADGMIEGKDIMIVYERWNLIIWDYPGAENVDIFS